MSYDLLKKSNNEVTKIDFKLDHFDKTLMFPFFINKVDHKFFSEEEVFKKHFHFKYNHNHMQFVRHHKQLFKDYNNIFDLSNGEKIKHVLNGIIAKIVAVTGTRTQEFFKVLGQDKNKKNLYVDYDDNYGLKNDLLGNYHDQKRYAFKIDVNENSYLAKIAKKLNFCFYLDHTKKKISGAFSYESFNRTDYNVDQAIDDFYFSNLVFQFIKEQFFPLTLDNILRLLSNDEAFNDWEDNAIRLEKIIDFKKVSLDQLEAHWKKTILEKYISFVPYIDEKEKAFLLHDLFYQILIVILIMIFSIEELKNFFTNENPHEVMKFLEWNDYSHITHHTDLKDDFLAMANLIHQIHEENLIEEDHGFDKKISLSKFEKAADYYYFCDPILINDFAIHKLINPSQIRHFLIENPDYFNYLFLLLYPEYFRLRNLSISQFQPLPIVKLNFMKLYSFDNKDRYLDHMLDHLCENDLYLHSFIRKNNVVLFTCLKNHDEIFEAKYQPYYYWAEIFMQTRLYELKLVDEIKETIRASKVKWKNILYRKILRDMHDMHYDAQNHFYGINNILSIVEQINFENKYQEKYQEVNESIQFEDELWKRGTERSNFMLAFIVAIMVGFENYFAMVFSATSDSTIVGQGWPGVDVHFPWVYTSIAVASGIEFMSMCILSFAVFRAYYTKKKFQEIDDHCFEK